MLGAVLQAVWCVAALPSWLYPAQGCPPTCVRTSQHAAVKGHQMKSFREGEAIESYSHFTSLLLVGEVSLVPASPGKDEAFLPVAPILAVRQHREVWHTTAGWVPACCLLICTHGEALGGHPSPYQG